MVYNGTINPATGKKRRETVTEQKITDQKVYLMVTITAEDVRAFNTFWTKESLPYWLKFGARHVGSFVNWIGGPNSPDNEIIRIFEFDNFTHYGKWEDWLHGPEGQGLLNKINDFSIKSQRRLLHAAPAD